MDTAMDMAMVRRIIKSSVYSLSFILVMTKTSFAADVLVTPSLETKLVYTDNVNSVATNEQTSSITYFTGGLSVQAKGNDGQLSLDYTLQQLVYSYDSEKNKLFNSLSFNADKGLFSTTNVRGNVAASISNVSRNLETNADNDVSNGNTIESRNAQAGLSYQSNPAGMFDLNTKVDASVTNNEDSVGNNHSYTGTLNLQQGQAAHTLFWSSVDRYELTQGQSEDKNTKSTEAENEFGWRTESGISPLVHSFYENYQGQGRSDSQDSASVGPGVRYYFSKSSYIEVGYDFTLKEDDSDSWRAKAHWAPSPRTSLDADYKQRFYGDAYTLSFKHTHHRLTNTVSYTESVSNYDRSLYIEGAEINQLSLTKTFSWESQLAFKRTIAKLIITSDKKQSMSNIANDTQVETYSSKLNLEHKLTRSMTLTPGFQFKHYKFYNQNESNQEDYYRKWDLELSKKFAADLSVDFELSYEDRSSTSSSAAYQENRVSLNVRKEL